MAVPVISILGAGNVGASCAAALSARRLGDIRLYDCVEDLAEGKAMDVNHATGFFHTDARVTGTHQLPAAVDGADVVVLTAGAPRKQGMKRIDLLARNLEVLAELAGAIHTGCPAAKVLIVSNPVDVLTYAAQEMHPEMNVMGLGCCLDTVRLRFFLAEAAGVSIEAVSAMVIGAHNDDMVPLLDHANIGGMAAWRMLSHQQMDQLAAQTRTAGADIVARLKTRGSYYAASWCVADLVEAIVRNTRKAFPVSLRPAGAYDYDDICLALPAMIGLGGVERILEIELDRDEREQLAVCAENMGQRIETARHLLAGG